MSRPVSKWVCLLLSAVITFSCSDLLLSQETVKPNATTAKATSVPYVAQVTGDQVNVRSGPAQVYYPVTTLVQGSRVIVRKEMFGWAKIEPTKGCFSYISKDFIDGGEVEGQSDGDAFKPFSGIVNANTVRVRAGSIKVAPAHADEVQTKLDKGVQVQIIGQRDGFYKVICPENCYFWVSLKFLKPADPKRVAVAEEIMPQTSDTKTALDVVPSQEKNDESEASSEVAPEEKALTLTQLEGVVYQQLVDLLDAEMDKPMLGRNYQPILFRLNEQKTQATSAKAKTSLKSLERHVKRADLALKIWKRSQQQDQQLSITLEGINKKIEKVVAINAPPLKRERDLVIKGRLSNSAVFTANHKNRRFLVLDEKDRITYYAIAAKDDLDLAFWVGRDVSLIGQATYDTFSKSRLLHVISVVELPSGLKK